MIILSRVAAAHIVYQKGSRVKLLSCGLIILALDPGRLAKERKA